jgi:hypothetical protein
MTSDAARRERIRALAASAGAGTGRKGEPLRVTAAPT